PEGGCRLYDHLAREAADIHLVIEALHRRAGVVPDQTALRRAAADDLAGEERVDVVDRIDLRRGDIRPAKAERTHAPLHLAEHKARLLAHALGRLVAEPDDALGVAGAALARLAAAGADKARFCVAWARIAVARHRIAEGVERRRGGRVDLGADIRARHRVQ